MELIRVQDSDYRKAYELYMTFDEDENGFVNSVYGYDYDRFLEWIEMKRNWSLGKELPEGFVADTAFVLSVDGEYVGVFNLRHYLNDFLRNGPGHIGYGISKKYRRKGYATAGLKLALGKAREFGIHEAYLSVNRDNIGSLKAQLNNGAYIHHEDDKKYYTRINAISESDSREKIISDYYNQTDEDGRLDETRHGQLEYATTMHYIHRFADLDKKSKILEVGAATGRYSIALAKEGFDVTAVDLVEKNIEILKKNSEGITNIHPMLGDATKLTGLDDDSFDVTMILGPMYHLYDREDVDKAIDEAIRVTKPGGTIMFAFISVFAFAYANHLDGNWKNGEKENFTEDYKVRHFKEQMFTGYDVTEFEDLFTGKETEYITTTGVDGFILAMEKSSEFEMSDEDFESLKKWYLAFSEKRELLGSSTHLLYICRKK